MTKLLTVSEAAAELRLSRSQVYELLKRGELRALSIGKSRRITPAELDRFIANKAETTADPVAV